MDRKIRVRFAPSPTGALHMGGVRTALYNYLFAKKFNGDFILRIEDTDQSRFVQGAEEYIVEALKWCGIVPNEGVGFGDGAHSPYRQSERKSIYRQYAEQLVSDGHAYYAFDTPEELDLIRKKSEAEHSAFSYDGNSRPGLINSLTLSEDEVKARIDSGDHYVIRICVPLNEEIQVNDIIRGTVIVHSSQMDDKVLFKSDGMPTYHLANVVDDYLMKITHVIRGEEWLPSAPLHVLLYRSFGWINEMPHFAHLPLLLRPDGNGKLSKRDGDRLGFPVFPLNWKDPVTGEFSSGYREKGYYPEAFINMLALLGWHPGDNQELFEMEELINEFSLDRVSKSGAKFDPEKTKWFNQQYLKKHSNEEIAEKLFDDISEKISKGEIDSKSFPELLLRKDFLTGVASIMREKVHFINEIWSLAYFLFIPPATYDDSVIAKRWNEKTKKYFTSLLDAYIATPQLNEVDAEEISKTVAKELQVKSGEVIQLLRVFISGLSAGPDLFKMIALIGKNETVNRLTSALAKLS